MILNALVRRYDALAAAPKKARLLPPPGWSEVAVSLCVNLNPDGTVAFLTDQRDEQRNDKGKTIGHKGKPMVVPENIPHANADTPNRLWDRADYSLGAGADKDGNPAFPAKHKGAETWPLFRRRNLEIVPPDPADPLLRAFRAFLESWTPEGVVRAVRESEGLPWKDLAGTPAVFRSADTGEFLHDNAAAKAAYAKWRGGRARGPEGVCMVTGERGPIAVSHSKIHRDAYLISFGKGNPAFSSHGWEQGLNAPVGEAAAHKYAAALRQMIKPDSGQVVQVRTPVGKNKTKTARYVFWTGDAGDGGAEVAASLDGDPFNRVDWDKRLRNTLQEWRKGNKPADPEAPIPFFVLGLSEANKARLSVRLWQESTLGKMRETVLRFYDETRIGADDGRDLPPLALLRGLNTAEEDGEFKLAAHEKLKGEFFSAVLSGGAYPAPALPMALARFRTDSDKDDRRHFRDRCRAALVKAFLIRNLNQEPTPMLNHENPSVPYQLGRLFAVLESVQRSAHGGQSPNATIRDRFIGAVLARPAQVFPTLLKLAAHHMRGGGHWGEAAIREIQNRIPAESGKPAIPRTLALEEQGMLFLGYHHQQEENIRRAREAAGRKKQSGGQPDGPENPTILPQPADAEQE